jgi:hypothetical protein
MPCPKGVAPETWAELTGALGEALSARLQVTGDRLQVGAGPSARPKPVAAASVPPDEKVARQGRRALRILRAVADIALRPPHGDAAASTLVYSASGALLSWGYFNPGDYDQNGVVGLSDLVPLAVHFGESTGTGNPFPENTVQAVIDGDHNGELNLADIIAIATNFGVQVQGYRVYAADNTTAYPPSPDSSNGTGAIFIGVASMSLAVEPPTGGRKVFNYQVVPTYAPRYFWVRPTDGETDGAASNYVVVVLPPKQGPIAKLANPPTTETLAHIVWNASTSFDPDGVISRYEWDFNADGVYDLDTGQVRTADFYYYAPGDYTCTVRVTDNDFYTDTASGTVVVTEKAKWRVTVVDELPAAPSSLSIYAVRLMDAAGHPALVYGELPVPGPVAYVRANDPQGTDWPAPVLLSPARFNGAAGVVDGNPAIALTVGTECHFVRADDPLGSSWGAGVVVPGLISANRLVNLPGAPALLAWPLTASFILAAAYDAQGTSWADAYEVPIETGVASLDIVHGLPCYVERSEDILFRRAVDLACTAWTDPVYVNPFERASDDTQLLDVGGSPAVFYYDQDMRALKFRRATDSSGALWNPPFAITSVVKPYGQFCGGTNGGRPVALYYDRQDDLLKFVAANNVEGTYWGLPVILHPTYDVENNLNSSSGNPLISFGEVAGCPAFGYAYETNNDQGDRVSRAEYVGYG